MELHRPPPSTENTLRTGPDSTAKGAVPASSNLSAEQDWDCPYYSYYSEERRVIGAHIHKALLHAFFPVNVGLICVVTLGVAGIDARGPLEQVNAVNIQ